MTFAVTEVFFLFGGRIKCKVITSPIGIGLEMGHGMARGEAIS
jgi:hypothetical protein